MTTMGGRGSKMSVLGFEVGIGEIKKEMMSREAMNDALVRQQFFLRLSFRVLM